MKLKSGLWIDHKKCVIVLINGNNIEKIRINSNAEKHQRQIDGESNTASFESQKVKSDHKQERIFTSQLKKYYDKIISFIHDSDSILIFGPGEAKSELLKRINKKKMSSQIDRIENSDKMTDPQIIAKVKDHLFMYRGN